MKAERRTVRCRDAADLAKRAAEEFASLASQFTAFALALSGGSTPKALYQALAGPALRSRVPWERVELFFGDERSVPPDHPDSNYRMATGALPSEALPKMHRMEAENGNAEAYQRSIEAIVPSAASGTPRFDLILLGIGPDGHTASLFPGTEALREVTHLVVMNDVPQMKTRRMTFTYPLINAAARVWVLAAGKEKRGILSQVFRSTDASRYPILGVDPTDGELTWWLDEAAMPAD
jgi:6-phosphogluconolactonase